MVIAQRLARLRKEMRREHLAAFIFVSSDPHDGEYVPLHWQGREWITGFTGSAGIAVVTMHSAALWTDSRYFLAAAQELAATEYVLMREKMAGTPTIAQWLGQELAESAGKEVGIDGTSASYSYVCALRSSLTDHGGLTLRTNLDILQRIWDDRPPVPTTSPLTLHPLSFAGEDSREKIARLRQQLRKTHSEGVLVTALDDIAWLLNLRGDDVPYNPVFVSYLLVSSKKVTLFIHDEKVSEEVREYLTAQGVAIAEYDDVWRAVRKYPDYSLLADPNSVNYALFSAIRCPHKVLAPSPIAAMKAVKNSTEIEGMRQAGIRDGVAIVRFLRWLEETIAAGEEVTECSADATLAAFRSEQEHYVGPSFATIAAYGAHGAIVHYEATAATDIPLAPHGFLLLDCGAHYLDGTTDLTRTLPLGPLSAEECRAYTLVLKGHIALSTATFPAGAAGTQLDALARAPLWREGYNFLHGTGHGVGAFLNVHEGPHQIRMEWCPAPIYAGTVCTDEPGIYCEGAFGVRLENLLLAEDYCHTAFGTFLQFSPLTFCPFATSPLVVSMLTADEVLWLNTYHQMVYATLCPLLSDDEDRRWLRRATLPLSLA